MDLPGNGGLFHSQKAISSLWSNVLLGKLILTFFIVIIVVPAWRRYILAKVAAWNAVAGCGFQPKMIKTGAHDTRTDNALQACAGTPKLEGCNCERTLL